MNVRTAKKPAKRIDTRYLSALRLQSYGADNLYPQHLQEITAASGTATTCLARYQKFIEGNGFANELADAIVNRQDMTGDDVLHQIAQDVARFGGFAVHVNYNVFGLVAEVNPVPFENCRLEESDDDGVVGHIVVHPDWSGRLTRNGQVVRVTEENVKRFPVFDPRPEVVRAQIESVGGIDNYDGQIMWLSMDGRFVYPTPIYDAAVTDISTDEGLGNIKYRNARNSFLVSCMLVTRRNEPRIDHEGREHNEPMIADDDLRAFQGDENASKIMAVELESMEDKPEVIPFPSRNFDKDFSVSEQSVIERIYAQFHQELFYSIRIGKLGFSGQVMQDAYEYYAGEVTNEQRFIARGLSAIFSHWYDKDYDTYIQPLRYINSENNG